MLDPGAGGSLAGKDSHEASSGVPFVRLAVAAGDHLVERRVVGVGGLAQRDAVLRALRAGEAGLDGREVELERVRVRRLVGALLVEEALLLRVRLDELDELLRTAGELEVAERLLVDREDPARRAVLGRHVADRRAVGQRQVRQPAAEVLHELADDALLAQHLRHGQDEVGGRRALGQLAGEPEPDHLRDQHRDRLAEHRGLGLDSADAPAEHAQAVDHRGVRVGADQRVRVGLAVLREHDAREVLEVHLVADARVRRDHLEVVERALPPAQERVALVVALELELGVVLEGELLGEVVDLDRVVDDQLRRRERVDLRRVTAQLVDRVAHRREVHDRRDAGEVLHQDARGREGDLLGRLVGGDPLRDRLDVVARDVLAVLRAQEVLEQDLQRVRKPRDVMVGLERVQPEDLVVAELRPGAEAVLAHASTP